MIGTSSCAERGNDVGESFFGDFFSDAGFLCMEGTEMPLTRSEPEGPQPSVDRDKHVLALV